MVRIMFGESYAKQLRQIPLADNTVGRRINDISEDILYQLVSRLCTSKFAIQVDEATDIAKDAHLIAYVRYVADNNILEDILFCKPILGKTTSIEIFNIIDSFFEENDIKWNNCVGLCTDGAHSMSGHKAGLQALVKKKAPHAIWTHCMLHRAALVSKNMSEELNSIFTKVIKIINYIKNSPLRARLFAKLCADMEANYTSLLYYCEVRWLSRAKMIQRVFELKEEIATFLEENQHEEAHLWTNDNFIVKLAYLVEIFGKLSGLNKSMQGSQIHPFVQKDKVKAFIKKLKLWKSNLQKNELDMFSLSKDFWATANIEASKNLFIDHLDGLVLHFSNYFKDLDFSKFLWIQNPFNYNEEDEFELTTIENEKLIELSCDSSLKQKF
ncbi:zinc finger BED domain-containing protein 5-like [Arctopsyche grandis]|uniref:zinc finger BED domain-containing protein 5-like n=1 Tax=Arctopsyche grandis TaxID=121162 RepID=UPI00406D8DE6